MTDENCCPLLNDFLDRRRNELAKHVAYPNKPAFMRSLAAVDHMTVLAARQPPYIGGPVRVGITPGLVPGTRP